MTARQSLCVRVGDVSVAFHLADQTLAALIAARYSGFLTEPDGADYDFEIETVDGAPGDPDEDVRVLCDGTRWTLSRGDFRAEWNHLTRRGRVRQTANPYSIDSVLRIVHTLALAPRGGFLLHAASVVLDGRAFLFSGVSGAGKTTISRLAPAIATLLTDEISYVKKSGDDARPYLACGTPFAGDLGRPGDNVKAPLSTLYLISHGAANRIEDVRSPVEAARALLANILFFANSEEMVSAVFESALEFVHKIPVKRLAFVPDARVWELIR